MVSQAAELKMPQAGGAQREPSMEEILASIRRIIEDSDQGRKPEDTLAEAPARAAEPESMERAAANAPTSKFDLPGQARMATEAFAAVARQPEAKGARPPEAAPALQPKSSETAWSESEPFIRRKELASHAAEPAAGGRTADEVDATEPAVMEGTAEPATPSMLEAAPAQPAPVEKASLISERTGRQVAAAFGELSEAFEASRRKTFDELASEMMRPMLQDWLDNNLPTLVEKLVREEIERVARGGR